MRLAHWLNNLNVQYKLIGAFALMFLVGILAIGWVGVRVNAVRIDIHTIVNHTDELLYLQLAETYFRQLEGLEKDYVLRGNPSDTDQIVPAYREVAAGLRQVLVNAITFATDADVSAVAQALLTELEAQIDFFEQLVSLTNTNPEAARLASYQGGARKYANIYEPLFALVRDEKLPELWSDNARIDMNAENAILVSGAAIALFVLVAGVIVLAVVEVVARQIVQPVRMMATVAEAVENQQFDIKPLESIGERRDEIGQLARVFGKMALEVQARVDQLERRVAEMQIVLDRGRMDRDVAEITDSEYFQSLQSKVRAIRTRAASDDNGTVPL